MKMNLQFFADEDVNVSTGAEVSEVANPMGTEVENGTSEVDNGTDGTEPSQDPVENSDDPKTTVDANAIAASIRRKLEKEAREKEARINDEFVRRFGSYKNPKTGAPIQTMQDYFEALDAQELVNAENEAKEKGVDADLIDRLVKNNPTVRQAEEMMKKMQEQEAMNQINSDVAQLSELDPSIKTYNDVPEDVVKFALDNHFNLVNAYKILNYGKTSAKTAEAIRQSTVNQIKGKQHLAPMTGVASNDAEVEIPAEERGLWEAIFPDKSYAERRTLYNKQL